MATKTKKPKKAKAPKPKQGYLDPEMAPPSIPEIDRLAEKYVDARDSRMSALKEEIELNGELDELMKKHSLTEYEYDNKIVSVNVLEKVKVKTKKAERIETNGQAE